MSSPTNPYDVMHTESRNHEGAPEQEGAESSPASRELASPNASSDSGSAAPGLDHEVSDEEAESIGEAIIAAIKTCYDPEIPVDIYELGLIYAVELEGRHAVVRMTLTSPMCPVAESLPLEVEQKVREVEGVESAEIDLVWEPQWSPDMMSEAARLELGF